MITRSYYQQLHRAGVKIYEYRPGFLHAKSIVSDDDIAVVGTINMDYRSFFLHFECATCFYSSSIVGAVKQDILETINLSRRIDDMWLHKVPWLRSIAASVRGCLRRCCNGQALQKCIIKAFCRNVPQNAFYGTRCSAR